MIARPLQHCIRLIPRLEKSYLRKTSSPSFDQSAICLGFVFGCTTEAQEHEGAGLVTSLFGVVYSDRFYSDRPGLSPCGTVKTPRKAFEEINSPLTTQAVQSTRMPLP